MTRLEGWSLSESDWTRLAELLSRVTWRSMKLRQLDQDSVPTAAGIYLLMTDSKHVSRHYRLPDGISNVIYVGRSNSLRRRFMQHASESPSNPLIKVSRRTFGDLRYAFAVVPSTATDEPDVWLSNVEAALVNTLSPLANRNIPHARPISARLATAQSVGQS